MQKWEYKSIVVYQHPSTGKWLFKHNGIEHPEEELMIVMNELGHQGWEQTSTLGFQRTRWSWLWFNIYKRNDTDSYIIFFKRPAE